MDLSPTVMTDDLCLTFGFFFYPEYASNNAQGPDMSASSNDNTFGPGPLDSQISPMEALPVTFSALVK